MTSAFIGDFSEVRKLQEGRETGGKEGGHRQDVFLRRNISVMALLPTDGCLASSLQIS